MLGRPACSAIGSICPGKPSPGEQYGFGDTLLSWRRRWDEKQALLLVARLPRQLVLEDGECIAEKTG